MPYVRSTFFDRQVFLSDLANQLEENAASHIHGRDTVGSAMFSVEFDSADGLTGLILKKPGHPIAAIWGRPTSADSPEYRLGTVALGADGKPRFQVHFTDSVLINRLVWAVDNEGAFHSIRAPAADRGSQIEAFKNSPGEDFPAFRLNSFSLPGEPSMTLELGLGGFIDPNYPISNQEEDTDVHIRRPDPSTNKELNINTRVWPKGFVERIILFRSPFRILEFWPDQDAEGNRVAVDFVINECDLLLESNSENAARFFRDDLVANPQFGVGRIVPENVTLIPRFRILYDDDNVTEREVMIIDREGILFSLTPLGGSGGPHLACYAGGTLYARLTSAGGVPKVELGPDPIVSLSRSAAAVWLTPDRFEADEGLTTRAVGSTPTDSVPDGTMYVDNAAHRLYVRSGGAWRYAVL